MLVSALAIHWRHLASLQVNNWVCARILYNTLSWRITNMLPFWNRFLFNGQTPIQILRWQSKWWAYRETREQSPWPHQQRREKSKLIGHCDLFDFALTGLFRFPFWLHLAFVLLLTACQGRMEERIVGTGRSSSADSPVGEGQKGRVSRV
jgi:hypothetical protein